MAIVDCDSERIWKNVENCRANVPKKRRQSSDSLSLFDRLYDCYVECSQIGLDKSTDKRFRNAVNLLERLSPNHAHPSLIVNLYPDEQGYSLILSPKKGSETEEFFLPYEDNEIFSYLDNQELPPVLVEVLGQTKYCHMYNGCVVCEVRDHRSFSHSHGNYDRHLLLLRPTAETIISTVEEMAFETGCSAEDKLMLESRLLLATQPPICLDPSTDVVCYTNRLQFNQRKFHTPAIRRTLRRRSHARRARMHMTSEGVAPRGLQLHDFITERTKTQPREKKRDFSSSWKKAKIDHSLEDTPETIFASVLQLAKPVTPPPLIESIPQLRRPLTTSQPKPHPHPPPQPHPQTVPRHPGAIHPPVDEREAQSNVVSGVQNDVAQLQGLPPPHPPMPLPDHPPHVPTCVANHAPQQIVDHTHPYHPRPPPSSHPSLPPPPVVSPPPISTSIPPSQPHPLTPSQPHPLTPSQPHPLTPSQPHPLTPSQPHPLTPSQPHSLTPTHPPAPPPLMETAPIHVQPTMQTSVNVPMSAIPTPVQVQTTLSSQTPPPLQAPPPAPPHSVTSQHQQPMINYGPIQLPPGVTPTPEIIKLVLAQYHAQSGKKTRPLAPAVSKPTIAGGGTLVDKSKPPALVGKPPPLSQGAVVVVPRSGGSSQVHVSSQMRPQLNLLSAPPPPPSLTPSPKKRPLLTHPTQSVSPGQAGMPKLHLLSHETSGQKSSLPPQPALSKPVAPPPPLSTSTAGVAPPTMPTLHKITTGAATLPHQQKPPQLHQQKTTPTVGGAIHAPPLRPNPNVAMPKLMTSLGQAKSGLATMTGMPVLSRAPVSLQPPPVSKPHPQKAVSSSSSKADRQKATPHSQPVGPPRTAGSKSHKQTSSSGKASKSKKKKK